MAATTDQQQWLDRIWALHSGPVFAYAARRVGRERAEDVVADTFVVAWRHREQRPQQDLPWLLGVARRVIGESYRADERWQRLQDRAAAERPDRRDGRRHPGPGGPRGPGRPRRARAGGPAALRLGGPVEPPGRRRPRHQPRRLPHAAGPGPPAPAPLHGRCRAHRRDRPGGVRWTTIAATLGALNPEPDGGAGWPGTEAGRRTRARVEARLDAATLDPAPAPPSRLRLALMIGAPALAVLLAVGLPLLLLRGGEPGDTRPATVATTATDHHRGPDDHHRRRRPHRVGVPGPGARQAGRRPPVVHGRGGIPPAPVPGHAGDRPRLGRHPLGRVCGRHHLGRGPAGGHLRRGDLHPDPAAGGAGAGGVGRGGSLRHPLPGARRGMGGHRPGPGHPGGLRGRPEVRRSAARLRRPLDRLPGGAHGGSRPGPRHLRAQRAVHRRPGRSTRRRCGRSTAGRCASPLPRPRSPRPNCGRSRSRSTWASTLPRRWRRASTPGTGRARGSTPCAGWSWPRSSSSSTTPAPRPGWTPSGARAWSKSRACSSGSRRRPSPSTST